MNLPTEADPQTPLDTYHRSWFTWAELEGAQGAYQFASKMGPYLDRAIDRGQRFGFSVMALYPDDQTNTSPSADGVGMSYPLYVHDLMQAEAVKDWKAPQYPDGLDGGIAGYWWVPNYNSPSFLDRWSAFNKALAAYFEANSYQGVRYKDVIGYVTIGGFGTWQEAHHYPFLVDATAGEGQPGAWPVGMTPTYQSLNRMVDICVESFPDFQIVAEMAWFDAHGFVNTWNPPETAAHVFTVSNAFGKLGWRRDNWNTTWYEHALEKNDRFSVGGVPGSQLIMNRWKEAPIGGEVYCDGSDMANLPQQVLQYGASTVGNGNYCLSTLPAALKDNYRAAMKSAGYRLVLNGGSLSASTLANGAPFSVSLEWQNVGNAPVYERWNVMLQLRDGAGAVAWEGRSAHELRLFLPQASGTLVTDTFTLASVPPGTYRLTLEIKDARGYRKPLPLAITGVQAGGFYVLAGSVAVK